MKQLNKASNLDTIKRNNRSLVLKLLNSTGGISRAELAKVTGLTKTSITNIVNDLIEEQLICETGIAESTSGRRPILLNIAENARYAIGLYISRDFLYANIANLNGVILHRRKTVLDAMENEQSFIAGIKEIIGSLLKDFSKDKSSILGIGVASIGPIDEKNGIILDPPNFRGLKSIKIAGILKKEFGFDTYVDNDTNACAIAEKLYGKAKNLTDFIYLGVTNGIGAGIFLNGSIYRGKDGFAGEIGHTSINAEGRQCACGNLGCLELYADINAVTNQVRSSLELGAESLLLERPEQFLNTGIAGSRDFFSKTDGTGVSTAVSAAISSASASPETYRNSVKPDITWENIVNAAKAGDRTCVKAVEKMAYYLSFGLINTVNTFNPQAIFLGHEIALAEDLIIEPLKEMLSRTILYKNLKGMKLEMSAFKENAPFMGAPSILFDKFFNGEI